MPMLTLATWLLAIIPLASAIILPPLTGNLPVGTITLELNDPSTLRDLMISIFYPTTSSCNNYTLASSFTNATAEFYENLVGLPIGTLETVETRAYLGAPLRSVDFPILLFSTGDGASRLLYNSLAEDIASLGYVVVTVDHPEDVAIIEYPDGRVVIDTTPDPVNVTYDYYIPFVENRTIDLIFVLDELSNSSITNQIPAMPRKKAFDTNCVGVFGHSLGGAVAATAMLRDSRFVAGVNLDGAIEGAVVQAGLSNPFFIMSSEIHNRTNDVTWSEIWGNLRGYKREVSVKGSLHYSFFDYLTLADDLGALLPADLPISELVGTINGTRMLIIESAYIGSFFDKFLKGGHGKLLDGPSPQFPEVSFEY